MLSLLLSGPKLEDVSPNLPHDVIKSRAAISGLTLAVVGDRNRLYAVSLNAGVWCSTKRQAWKQLPNSPGNVNCIAIDPTRPNHLAIGQRDGFAVEMKANFCGVQESFDSGEHWRLTYDPLTYPGCGSEAISSICFDSAGNLYAGTSVGVAYRAAKSKKFSLSAGDPVLALSSSKHSIWARTLGNLSMSSDGGMHWHTFDIPTQVDSDRVTFSSRGDAFSLAATDEIVIMPCVLTPGVGGNRNSVLAFDVLYGKWLTETLQSGNGTGLGGRRFTKSYPGMLLYGAGQEIHQSSIKPALGSPNPILFDLPVQTSWGGPYGSPPHEIHSDTWDMHLDPQFGSGNFSAWISCDGGVFEAVKELRDPNSDPLRLFNHRWLPYNDGLHTHHVHTITALQMPGDRARLAYPTSDNDAFYYDPQSGWMNESWLGDVNWTLGDVGNPNFALMVRRSAGFAMLTAFHQPAPKGANFAEDAPFSICNDEHYDGPTSLSFIQTLPSESNPNPLLDAVRLVDLPLKAYDGAGRLVVIKGPLGQKGRNPVLIRNTKFAANPDINTSKGSGWLIEIEAPVDTTEFWVSGGHSRPTYFAYAKGNLYRSVRNFWKKLDLNAGGRPFELLAGNQFGPVFVNPFDPKVVYVLAKDGVKVSQDGGDSFSQDSDLTRLITEEGKYPLIAGELTGKSTGVVLASRSNSSATLAQVVFDREHPDTVAACSPFTGVMMRSGQSGWTSLRKYLPRPLPPIVSIAIANESVYCGSEGRGVFRIKSYRQALSQK